MIIVYAHFNNFSKCLFFVLYWYIKKTFAINYYIEVFYFNSGEILSSSFSNDKTNNVLTLVKVGSIKLSIKLA